MTFVDICWYFPLYLVFTVWLRFVNHLLNYLLTYLLTYLRSKTSGWIWIEFPDRQTRINRLYFPHLHQWGQMKGDQDHVYCIWRSDGITGMFTGVDCTSPPRRRGPTAKCFSSYTLSRGAGRVSGQGGQNSALSAEKFFSFAHPGFQFAHPAIRNGRPPCPPYRGGFKGKGWSMTTGKR